MNVIGQTGSLSMDKPYNNKAWFLVIPVFLLVALSAIIPLMTVVNYSFQDTFGNNQFFWAGLEWFEEMLESERMWNALWPQLGLLGMIILAIEVPLGILVALNMPKKGLLGLVLPGADVAAAADPVERGRHHLADLRPGRHRPAGLHARPAGDLEYNYTSRTSLRLGSPSS
jgi:ABC-type sulfate transport system permease subunit